MYRQVLRISVRSSAPRSLPRANVQKRFVSTAPVDKPRSLRGSLLRWGLAVGAVYYYNTSNVFAEEPAYRAVAIPETETESETYQTVDSIAARRKQRAEPALAPATYPAQTADAATVAAPLEGGQAGSPDELEEEAGQQGAFNPETGEINWDCPCLGGMAHGPCGEQFKAAFSCFVYSQEEQKGVDCIDKFKDMQDCFRQHPDVYAAELDDDEEDAAAPAPATEAGITSSAAPTPETPSAAPTPEALSAAPTTPSAAHARALKVKDHAQPAGSSPADDAAGRKERAQAATQQVKQDHGEREGMSESDAVVPKAAHDAR